MILDAFLFKRDEVGAQAVVEHETFNELYCVSDWQIQELLKVIYRFQNFKPVSEGSTERTNYSLAYTQEKAMAASEYVRGIADSLQQGDRLHDVADLLEVVSTLFHSQINIMHEDIEDEKA